MTHHYGKENLTRLSRESKCGPGSMSRIKACDTSIGIGVLEKVAAVFDLQAWQLLVPHLDPANPPVIVLNDVERKLYERLKKLDKAIKETSA